MGGFLPWTWLGLPALVTLAAAAAAFRAPCVPLDVATPYQSTWSCSSEVMAGGGFTKIWLLVKTLAPSEPQNSW